MSNEKYECPRCGEDLERFKSKKGQYFWRCRAAREVCNELYWDNDGEPKLQSTSREPAADDIRCPECGGAMHIVTGGKYGDFFSCADYPACKGARDIMPDSDPPEPAPDCPDCQSPMRVRKSSKGMFLGCGAYPKCEKIMEINNKNNKKGDK